MGFKGLKQAFRRICGESLQIVFKVLQIILSRSHSGRIFSHHWQIVANRLQIYRIVVNHFFGLDSYQPNSDKNLVYKRISHIGDPSC